MLSTETPSDPPPSLSSKHLPTFSIRDYVFTTRKEHIEKNWPFSHHHLQLFSKHEIKDILPPFESPESVRNLCRRPVVEVDPSSSEENNYSPPHQSLKLSTLVIDDAESERESALSNGQQQSESPLDLPTSQLPQKKESVIEPSGRKCRLIVKLGVMTHSEEIASNSDSMASKLCPVCKTFSSTSNTTLNAHIDQCLAAEPTPKSVRDDSKLTKHMTNPTKKRSMLDIYATAKSCTLEELDKRNGSNWAANFSSLTAQPDAIADEKRPRLSDAPLQGPNDENPVYFDSSGTKIRIISRISNAPVAPGDEPKKLLKDGKQTKTISFEVKNNFQLKNVQHPKGKLRSKKLCSLGSNKLGLSREDEMNNGMDKVCHKEDSRQLLKAGDCNESGTLKWWICSKRSNILRKARTKGNRRGLRLSSLITTNPLTESNKMNFGDSSRRDSDSSGNVVSSPTTTHTDTSRYESQLTECTMDSHRRLERKLSPLSKERISDRNDGCFLKLPKSQGKFASSPRSKRVDVSVDPTGNAVCFAKEKNSSLNNELVTKPSFSSLKSKLNGKQSILKKHRVHISINDMDGLVESQPLHIEQPYDSGDSSAENLYRRYATGVTHNSNGSSDEVMPEVEVSIDSLSLDGVGVLSSMRGESTRILEWGNSITEEASCAGTEYQYHDVDATFKSHVKTPLLKFNSTNNTTDNYDDLGNSAEDYPVNVDVVGGTFTRKAGVPISKSIKTVDSEFHIFSNPMDAQSNALQSSGEQQERCLCRSKMSMPFLQQKVSDSEVCRIGPDANMSSEVNSSRFVATSSSKCLVTKCGNSPPYVVPALPGSVSPTLGNGNSADHLEKSSLTSSKMPFTKDELMVPNRNLSESHVSMTSPISRHTKTRSSLINYLNPESFTKPLEVEDKLVLGFWGEPTVEATASLQFANGTVGAERVNSHGGSLKARTISPAEESMIYTGDGPCCLRSKSLALDAPQKYQDLHLHCTGEGSIKATAGKQVECSRNTGPEIPDSFVFSRNSHTIACESPGGSVSTHFTSQDAQSTPNSVVRLMGKNLMVANKDEDAFVKLRQPAPVSSNSCTSMTCLNLLRCTLSNQVSVSSHFEVPEASVVSSQGSCTPRSHFFSDDLLKSFTSQSCSRIEQRQSMVGNGNAGEVDSSLIYHGLKSKAKFPIDQKKTINRLDSFPYKVEGVVAPVHLQHLNHASAVQKTGIPATEVIVIEDSPESEAELSRNKGKYVHGLNESRPSPVAVLPPTSTFRSMPHNAFCYRTANAFPQMEPLIGNKLSFPVLHHGDASNSTSNWGPRDPFASKIYQFRSLS